MAPKSWSLFLPHTPFHWLSSNPAYLVGNVLESTTHLKGVLAIHGTGKLGQILEPQANVHIFRLEALTLWVGHRLAKGKKMEQNGQRSLSRLKRPLRLGSKSKQLQQLPLFSPAATHLNEAEGQDIKGKRRQVLERVDERNNQVLVRLNLSRWAEVRVDGQGGSCHWSSAPLHNLSERTFSKICRKRKAGLEWLSLPIRRPYWRILSFAMRLRKNLKGETRDDVVSFGKK
jgi:hypothetical protein